MYKTGNRCQIPILTRLYEETFGYHDRGFFVEVGAFDCHQWSNCWTLAEAGWRGIFVEPQPEYASRCLDLFGESEKIQIVEVAVSTETGVANLRLAGSLATIKESRAADYDNSVEFGHFGVGSADTIEVTTISLDDLLVKYHAPQGFEVLSIDVEGSEMDVLQGFAIDYWRPDIVIVEAHEQSKEEIINYRAPLINQYFAERNYAKIYSDHINNIYKRN